MSAETRIILSRHGSWRLPLQRGDRQAPIYF